MRLLHRAPRRPCREVLLHAGLQADGGEVTTIEGIATGDAPVHPVQEAFRECHGLQCGYCTPGMVMSSIELLKRTPHPTDEQIREGLEGNICRCTGYENIVHSVERAAELLAARKE